MSNEYLTSLTLLKLHISGLIYVQEEEKIQAQAEELLLISKEPKCNMENITKDRMHEIMRILLNICTTNNLTLVKLQCERLKEKNWIAITRWLHNYYEYTIPSFSEYMREFSTLTFAERGRSLNDFSIREVFSDASGLRVVVLYYALHPDEFAELVIKAHQLDSIQQLTWS